MSFSRLLVGVFILTTTPNGIIFCENAAFKALKKKMLSEQEMKKTMVQLPGTSTPVSLLSIIGQQAYTSTRKKVKEESSYPATPWEAWEIFQSARKAGWYFDENNTFKRGDIVVVQGPRKNPHTIIYGVVVDKGEPIRDFHDSKSYIVQINENLTPGILTHYFNVDQGGWMLTPPHAMGKMPQQK